MRMCNGGERVDETLEYWNITDQVFAREAVLPQFSAETVRTVICISLARHRLINIIDTGLES